MRLLADADDEVRCRLIAANPHRPPPVTIAATGKVKAGGPRDYLAAQERLSALKLSGQLDADAVDASVRAGSFADVVVAIALLTGLPIGVAENALLKRDLQLFMILAKACQLTWSTVLQILTIRCQLHGRDWNKAEFDRSFEAFNGVQPATAQRCCASCACGRRPALRAFFRKSGRRFSARKCDHLRSRRVTVYKA